MIVRFEARAHSHGILILLLATVNYRVRSSNLAPDWGRIACQIEYARLQDDGKQLLLELSRLPSETT